MQNNAWKEVKKRIKNKWEIRKQIGGIFKPNHVHNQVKCKRSKHSRDLQTAWKSKDRVYILFRKTTSNTLKVKDGE